MEPESILSKLGWWVCRLVVRIILALPAIAAFIAAAVGGWDLAGQIVYWFLDGAWFEETARQFLGKIGIMDRGPITEWGGLNRILEWFLDIHPIVFFTGLALMLTGVAGGIRATLPGRLTKPAAPKPRGLPQVTRGPFPNPNLTSLGDATASPTNNPAYTAWRS